MDAPTGAGPPIEVTSSLSALEWFEVGRIAIGAFVAFGVILIQLEGARSLPSGTPGAFVIASILPVVPFAVVYAALPWWPVPRWLVVSSIVIWIGGLVAFAVVDWRNGRTRPSPPITGALVDVGDMSVRIDPSGVSGELPRAGRPRIDRLVALIGATLIAVSHTVAAVAFETSCEEAADLLAGRRPAAEERDPAEWMPSRFPPGTATDGRRLDLEGVVALRVDGDAGRQALLEAGFVDAYLVRSVGPDGGASVFAQRFASPDGAMAFDAYATTYACRFATDAFTGPNDGVGMHIRYAGDPPFSRQASWVSGSTRILVNVSGDAPILDDDRLDDLVGSIP